MGFNDFCLESSFLMSMSQQMSIIKYTIGKQTAVVQREVSTNDSNVIGLATWLYGVLVWCLQMRSLALSET